MNATYNITNNRLFFWPEKGTRLPEDQYNAAKAAGFVWWPRGCFTAIWSPAAEDWIRSHGLTLSEDDTPDNIEARVERFEKYAANDEQAATSAADRLASGTAHTARQVRQAEGTAESKTEEAAYWHNRIAGAIAHAEHHDRPDVIARRIKGLDANLRKWIDQANPQPYSRDVGQGNALWVGTGGRCGRWVQPEDVPAMVANANRWIEHLTMRLEYERAYLKAAGGSELLEKKPRRVAVAPEDGLKKGMKVSYRSEYYGQSDPWEGEILSMGANYVRVTVPPEHDPHGYYSKGAKILRKYVTQATA